MIIYLEWLFQAMIGRYSGFFMVKTLIRILDVQAVFLLSTDEASNRHLWGWNGIDQSYVNMCQLKTLDCSRGEYNVEIQDNIQDNSL